MALVKCPEKVPKKKTLAIFLVKPDKMASHKFWSKWNKINFLFVVVVVYFFIALGQTSPWIRSVTFLPLFQLKVSLSLSLLQTLTHTITHSHTLAHTLGHTHTHTLGHTCTFAHTHTHSLFLSFFFSQGRLQIKLTFWCTDTQVRVIATKKFTLKEEKEWKEEMENVKYVCACVCVCACACVVYSLSHTHTHTQQMQVF